MKQGLTAAKDITLQQFGKLTAVSLCEKRSKHGQRQWLCECTCGKKIKILQHSLTSGNTKSCGEGNCKSHRVNNHYKILKNYIKIDISTPKHKKTFALIDFQDFDLVLNKKNKSGNVTRWIAHSNSPGALYAVSTDQRTKMHRLILGLTGVNELADHGDGDGLNNRRHNLTKVSSKQNAKNCRRRKDNTSGYTGVQFDKSKGLFKVEIYGDKGKIFVGSYDTLRHGNIAYRAAAKVLGYSDRHGT